MEVEELGVGELGVGELVVVGAVELVDGVVVEVGVKPLTLLEGAGFTTGSTLG